MRKEKEKEKKKAGMQILSRKHNPMPFPTTITTVPLPLMSQVDLKKWGWLDEYFFHLNCHFLIGFIVIFNSHSMEIWGFRGDLEIWWPSSSCSGAWFCEWIKERGHFFFLGFGKRDDWKKKKLFEVWREDKGPWIENQD